MNVFNPALLLAILFCVKTQGQGAKRDPYFIESTEIVSKYAPDHITREIVQDRKGNYWFATWVGIVEYDGKVFTNHTLKDQLVRFHVISCYEDKKGDLWFGTAGGGVYCYDGRKFRLYTEEDGLVSDYVTSILEDKDGSIWFGTKKGLSRYEPAERPKPITQVSAPGGELDKYINCLIEDKKGKVWVGTSNGLFIYDKSSFTAFRDKTGKPFKNVSSLLEDRDGHVWIGRMDGLTRYDGRTCSDLFADGLCYYIMEDRKGNVWLNHSERNEYYVGIPNQVLYRYDGKSFAKVAEKGDENDFQIFGKAEDRQGNIWFGTMHGPCRYDGKSFTYFTR